MRSFQQNGNIKIAKKGTTMNHDHLIVAGDLKNRL
jgi:hypothetical protein